MSIKVGGALARITDSVDESIQGLEKDTKRAEEKLIIENRNEEKNKCTDNSSNKLPRFHAKKNKTWLRKEIFMRETESLPIMS